MTSPVMMNSYKKIKLIIAKDLLRAYKDMEESSSSDQTDIVLPLRVGVTAPTPSIFFQHRKVKKWVKYRFFRVYKRMV